MNFIIYLSCELQKFSWKKTIYYLLRVIGALVVFH